MDWTQPSPDVPTIAPIAAPSERNASAIGGDDEVLGVAPERVLGSDPEEHLIDRAAIVGAPRS